MRENKLIVQIEKPVGEVFEFTTNPKNTHKWIDSIEVEETNEWPVRMGSVYRNKSKGSDWSEYVVSDYKENEVFEITSKDGKYTVRYIYKPINEDSTEMTYHEWMNEGELENPFPQSAVDALKLLMES